ncbi:MAG: ABC transporter ATP-binding protein [Jaaginema sp. PMC 1079.18]|nr:ABC transporter ATP-binding protein [Jaaginema sp. PMC 1080.18]MEC4851957.1 ABC transporter ATP-binding protein [Jaaginema sp. PMC 1079.18]MEC4868477.1 ABC transporter ATP-binding protein [Jaaginema sp. PMC 1078.18]
MTEKTPIIQTWELTKTYRTGFWMQQKIESLKNCTLTVYEGETFGILGPNGAGKTTLFKTLLGIVKRTSGRAVVLGQPVGDRAVKQYIGYLPENAYFYDSLTGWEFLQLTASLFNIPRSVQSQRITELLDLVGVAKTTAKNKRLRQYSKGMLQRIGVAQALINNPEIVFLDEPMSGLDPIGRYRIRQIILSLKEQGKTIFLNSHILSDVEEICDRVAILAQGNLRVTGSLDELLGNPDTFQIIGQGGNFEQLKQDLINFKIQGDRWQGQIQGNPTPFLATLEPMNAQILSLSSQRLSLEDYFMQQLQNPDSH